MYSTEDHILQEFYTLFLTRFRTYKIASPPLTKMTSKDDIKGFVPSSMVLSLVTASLTLMRLRLNKHADPHAVWCR